ncbi:hypothetical protein [Pseudonocardia abyssalis]|uniref:Mce-associated membrane protein n=1 Tax=Pseudonocardia abyssalis TaxID=2792008 RepID=A0ABS6USU9_9PSEU|nr:hypothetical protein [Pseudonocardia abyssalis]MBW0115357.1 hypothetical protein [Pseudonocardia abyssalis]MBW0135336.1 hypothetical protein [Pseudonocardia abyssalis]
MRIRGGTVAAALLGVLFVVGLLVAWSGAGQAVSAVPPLRAAPAIPPSGVGSSEVLLSADALAHPAHELVRAQLQRHYDAINAKDYAEWVATVVPERSEALPEEAWREAYDSSQDGTIRIDRIDDLDGARVLVRVRFVSIQDVEDAPQDVPARRICWRSSLPMSGEPPLIEQTGAGSSIASPC